MDKRILKLREILCEQISWYKENIHDENHVYDDLCNEFSSLSRGDYVDIIETILSDEKDETCD